ncbi:hypothetical protein RHMOL_Rhmol02G0048900 [Rhododendron molle]|uniref:Uncharacterized protein n=1 Tax=Rhododendron molle TaxID=49168 RepID=A0ACC0PLZ0_RHOML|nr:hypothetical protein RHMOL_Rhmol02G0048900 [Rhododendron molle]
MATPFHLPVTAAQVGTYFVGQYYQVLQHQPDLVHQFYSDASTMLRIEEHAREAASGMLQIHSLVMSLHYTGIEIKTAHSLESWNGGVLVMVSGSVLMKNFSGRRKFAQTFFLAPQEKGYFVLNDIFHFIDEEPFLHHPVAYLPQSSLDSKVHTPATIREPVPDYMLGGETQAREFVVPADVKENGRLDDYSYSEQQLQHIPEAENILEDNFAQSNGSLQSSMDPVPELLSAPVEEPVGEPQKHTYASIVRTFKSRLIQKSIATEILLDCYWKLQVTKGQPATPAPIQPSFNKSTPSASEWNSAPELPSEQTFPSSIAIENSGAEAAEEVSAVEDEGEVKSVYVRNLPLTVSALEIEEEFMKFGRLKPDAVAIRNRKDIGVCYAFVEFEDISGVHNAIQASTVQIAGHQVFIEGRRANRFNASRGGIGMYNGVSCNRKIVLKNISVFWGEVKEEGGGEAGVATIQQRYQGDVLVVGITAEEMATMETTTIDPGGMGITDQRHDKTEGFHKHQVNISQTEGLEDSSSFQVLGEVCILMVLKASILMRHNNFWFQFFFSLVSEGWEVMILHF